MSDKYAEVVAKPEDVEKALKSFIDVVRARYGTRLHSIVLFGSRARGDMRPDSDADVAVIIDDGDWRPGAEKMALADLAYDALIDFGLRIQPWALSVSAWKDPERYSKPSFARAIRRDARTLLEPA